MNLFTALVTIAIKWGCSYNKKWLILGPRLTKIFWCDQSPQLNRLIEWKNFNLFFWKKNLPEHFYYQHFVFITKWLEWFYPILVDIGIPNISWWYIIGIPENWFNSVKYNCKTFTINLTVTYVKLFISILVLLIDDGAVVLRYVKSELAPLLSYRARPKNVFGSNLRLK